MSLEVTKMPEVVTYKSHGGFIDPLDRFDNQCRDAACRVRVATEVIMNMPFLRGRGLADHYHRLM